MQIGVLDDITVTREATNPRYHDGMTVMHVFHTPAALALN
jgi:hypothetical protein